MKVIYSYESDLLKATSPQMPDKGGLNVIIANYMDFEFPMHSHDFNELIIVMGGTGKHLINNEAFNLIAGDVFVLKGNDVHSIKDTKGLIFANIAFAENTLNILRYDIKKLPGFHALFVLEPFFRSHKDFISRLRLSAADLLHISELISDMEKEYSSTLPASESIILAYFMQLVVFLSRRYGEYVSSSSSTIYALVNTISYIENNYTEQITLQELSDLVSMSTNHFLRIFKDTYNTTPMNYIKQLRIRKSCELMSSTSLSITDIAYNTGFQDSNYFSRVFKSVIGKTPSEYRKYAQMLYIKSGK